MPKNFEPRRSIELSITYWRLIVILTILGSLAGWLISLASPVIYEARAEITSSVDFTRTGTLTDIEQDQIIVPVGDVISSTKVLEAVTARAKDEGYEVNITDFRNQAFVERKNLTWVIRVRNADIRLASRLTDIWVETAVENLENGLSHANKAEQYKRYLDSLAGCIGQTTISEPSNGTCGAANLEALQKEIITTGTQLDTETNSSLGLSTALRLSEHTGSENQSMPASNEQSTLVFSCAMIGFVLGILMCQTGFVTRFRGKK